MRNGIGIARIVAGIGILALAALGIRSVYVGRERARISARVDAFVAAAGKGDLPTVRTMADADPLLVHSLRRDKDNSMIADRPLHAAAAGLHPDVVEFLVGRGADVQAELGDGSTPLHVAGDMLVTDEPLSKRRAQILAFLLDHGADVAARDHYDRTPLHTNAHDAKAVELLLARHADVNARDEGGATPLHAAAGRLMDDSAAVQMLIEHGADVNARDHSGHTPLLVAKTAEVMETLVERGASATVRDNTGRTALHAMADMPTNLLADIDALGLLCASGLAPDVRDSAQKTPLDIARARLASETDRGWLAGRRRIVQFLLPGGPCERLAHSAPPPTKEQRAFVVAEALCGDGSGDACARVAWFYDTGKGVAANPSMAATWYEKACRLGSQPACTNLAYDYEHGEGVPADPPRAVPLYTAACDAGESQACFNLALMYAEGRAVAADAAKAAALFRRACDAGDADACARLR